MAMKLPKIGIPDKVLDEKTTEGNGNGNKRGTVNMYEAFMRQTEVISGLRQLRILPSNIDRALKGMDKYVWPIPARALLYEWNDSTKDKNSTAGAAQQLNKVFVAGHLPFFAKAGGRKAPKMVLISRVGKAFEPRFFGIKEGYELRIKLGQNKSDGIGGEYEKPTDEMIVRVTEWLKELKEFGIDFFSEPVSEKVAGEEILKLPDGSKEVDRKLYESFENSYLQRYTDEGIRRVNVIIPEPGKVSDKAVEDAVKNLKKIEEPLKVEDPTEEQPDEENPDGESEDEKKYDIDNNEMSNEQES